MKKKINVLYIITKLELGGAQKVCLSLFDQLSTNHNAFLISGKEGKLVETVSGKENVILLSNLTRELSPIKFFNELRAFIKLVKEIKKIKSLNNDLIVHTHSTKAGIIGRWAALFAGVKKRVHTVHGFAFHDHQNFAVWFLIYFAELLTSLITTHFICVSSADAKTGIKLFPKFSKKHSIIRAAVDWNKFFIPAHKAKEFTPQQFIFGTVACFKKQKNMFDLLNAFALAHSKNNNIKLEIIGDGILRTEIEKWITSHKLENSIKLHGWQHNVAELMLNWNAFVLSSLWEGLPCAIIEARLLKLPILAYDTGGISDVIKQNKNGFLYKQKDWRSLADGMISISSNKNLYSDLQNHSENLDDFNEKNMFKKHLNLYENI